MIICVKVKIIGGASPEQESIW